MIDRLSIAVVGAGKIARDQHIPAIAGSDAFSLSAIVDPAKPDLGVPAFTSLADLPANGPAIDAVAICTPPQVRTAIALDAIGAGLHVLLEKPPAATLSEVAAINAFSILTAITDAPWSIARSDFQIPAGLHAPISAQLEMRVGGTSVAADLHFHDYDTAEWTIALETDDGMLELRDGGATLSLDGGESCHEGKAEYPAFYGHFADLIAQGRSEIDARPLRLVADAFLLAKISEVESFEP